MMGAIAVRVQPRARQRGLAGWLGGVLKVRVTEPPEDGRANRAVESVLAEALGLAPSRVHVVRGASSRSKTVEVDGLDEATLRQRLAQAQPGGKGADDGE